MNTQWQSIMEKNFIKDQVTVVIPVYNEERFLRECLESVVHQVDCIVIGDNASTDNTEMICREFVEKYPHIRYFRHEKNNGSVYNCNFCYQQVETEFVFHVGGHDIIPDNYVSSLKKILLERDDAVAAYSNVFDLELDGSEGRKEFYDKCKDRKNEKLLTDYLENESGHIRAAGFFLCPTPLYLIYALFRSEVAIPCQWQPVGACDWIVVFDILLRGKFIHSIGTHYIRRNNHPVDSVGEYMKRITAKEENNYYSIGNKMFWQMIEIVLKHFSDFDDNVLSVYKKWDLYWQIEKYLCECYQFSKKIEIPNLYQKIPFWYLCYHKIIVLFRKIIRLPFKIVRKMIRISTKIWQRFFQFMRPKL
jgi:glycosyltransferase involved in cell wall biosynthesis